MSVALRVIGDFYSKLDIPYVEREQSDGQRFMSVRDVLDEAVRDPGPGWEEFRYSVGKSGVAQDLTCVTGFFTKYRPETPQSSSASLQTCAAGDIGSLPAYSVWDYQMFPNGCVGGIYVPRKTQHATSFEEAFVPDGGMVVWRLAPNPAEVA